MKENFGTSLAHVLKSEGLWSDNPQDPGGATMKGITFEVYKDWKRNPHLTKNDLKAITDQEVHDLYKALYWNKVFGDNLPSGIDYAVFDAAVNMGVGRATKLLQESVGVTADGVIGQGTLRAIYSANPQEVINKFSEEKANFYQSLKTFPVFGRGWLNRIAEVKQTASMLV
jgi:lysozyme family protein